MFGRERHKRTISFMQTSLHLSPPHTSNRFLFGLPRQAGVNKTWQNKQSMMRPARNIRDAAAHCSTQTGKRKILGISEPAVEVFKLFSLTATAHSNTPTAAEKISIKTNCNKFYSTHETNVFSLWLSLEQIIKCVIKRSWDVGTRYLATEAPASLSDGKKYIIIVYVYVWCLLKICWLLLNIRYR